MSGLVPGLLAVAGDYDGFVFDQFGVLHNGTTLYANAVEVLGRLHEAGKPVWILSNSGRSAAANRQRLGALGIDGKLIEAVITSGDVARQRVLPRYVRDIGPNCFQLASAGEPADLADGIAGLCQTSRLEDCDFVYLSGMAEGLDRTWRADLLSRLIVAGPPLLCANPDFAAPQAGGLATSPGTIAQAYREAGGRVELVGKPHPLIYEVAAARLREANCARALFVGDSYQHDIVGARRSGYDAFLVQTGVYQADARDDGFAPTWTAPTL